MLSDTYVQCDECDWTQEVKPVEVLCWRNKCCPICGAIIITDAEARFLKFLIVVSNFSDWLCNVYKFFTGRNPKLGEIHIDSAFLRK
jgi:hypothetical protein